MILITGAAGKTGRAILNALIQKNSTVRVLVRRPEQAEELMAAGAKDVVVGDMADAKTYREALKNVVALYHICPNMHPAEIEIGRLAIESARKADLKHFVYHSVLHPQTEKMPHHWHKMRVEELLFESGLCFTILQPAPYMQNILAAKEAILEEGVYLAPYPAETMFSLIDLLDLGEAAAAVLTEEKHRNAVYELSGTTALTQSELVFILAEARGTFIRYEEISIADWCLKAAASGLSEFEVETLTRMFRYYAAYGLRGSTNQLSWLLGRKPTGFLEFAKREIFEDLR
jgi:NAD(P)H dehydrogenase (quinone)